MPNTSANTCNPCVLCIAGVRLILPDLPATTVWPAAFRTFLGEKTDADLICEVQCLGADPSLADETPDPATPWLFRAQDGQCELTRRAADGVVLWRMRAPLSFEHTAISWHPERFPVVYGDYISSWTSGLGLSLLVFRLRACGGLVLHGSAAVLDGQGILCSGVSGVGKSTIARLLQAAGAAVLTDERPIIRQVLPACLSTQGGVSTAFHVHGSPWPSSAGFAVPARAPLRRIYFLEHGATNRLTPLTPREAFQRLIHVATIPWHNATLFDPCLQTVEALLQTVPCAVLSFRPTPEVVEMIREDLNGQGQG